MSEKTYAFAAENPGAKLLTLEGLGHEIHSEELTEIIDAIAEHPR